MKLLVRIAWPIWKTIKHVNFTWLIAVILIGNFLVLSLSHVDAANDGCRGGTSANGVYQGACDTQSGNIHDIGEGLITQISGPSTTSTTSSEAPSYQQGAIYQIGHLDDVMYHTPPASAIVWAMDQYQQVAGSRSIMVSAQNTYDPSTTSTYFPGLGFDLLRPILGLWTWTRNIAYGFFIIILIVIAFLILFRQQLGGGAAVSVANSLPSIILSLVLVTLSYPLSAAFVDLVYVGSGFLQSVMITSPGAPGEGTTTQGNLNTLQPDDREMSIWGIWGTANALVCQGNSDCSINTLLPADLQQDNPQSGVVGKAIGVFTNAFNAGNGIVGNTLIRLLITLIALGATIKLFLALLNNYLILTTMPIFAPFVFLTAAIPGRSGSVISNYFKMLLAASLVFIAIYGIFLFLVLIGNSEGNKLFGGALESSAIIKWGPPLLGYSTDQIAGGIYKTILIYAVYLFAPSVPDLIKGNLGVPTGNVFFQTVFQRTTANFGFINQVRARASTYLPGSEGGG